MEELGLASRMTQETPAGMGAGSKTDPMVALNEVVKMLEQGATPEELVAAGIPREVVEAALDMLTQQIQQGPQSTGLAGMQIPGGV